MAKENQIQIFQYNGSPITFNSSDSVMVNATEMAKPFGKSANHWLRNKSTEEFITELARLRICNPTDLVQVTNGGNGDQGTWMHEDVAMEFARWLSPAFAIWCNDRIKELLTKGVSTIQRELSRKELAQMIIQAEEEKEKLQLIAHEQEEQLKIQAPKVEYHDKVLSSQGYLTTNMIASCLGMTSIKLNKLLCSWGIQYKESSTYYLYSKFRDKGYAVHKPYPYTDSDGNIKTRQQMYWTETGKQFILSTYNQRTA
jgi:phage antirepressor YoqD-like protein